MHERACSLIIMIEPIEFYDTPDECTIDLSFEDGRTKQFRCRVNASYKNTVSEIYDKDDEIIATSMQDLRRMGVVSASVQATHSVEVW